MILLFVFGFNDIFRLYCWLYGDLRERQPIVKAGWWFSRKSHQALDWFYWLNLHRFITPFIRTGEWCKQFVPRHMKNVSVYVPVDMIYNFVHGNSVANRCKINVWHQCSWVIKFLIFGPIFRTMNAVILQQLFTSRCLCYRSYKVTNYKWLYL